MYFGGDTEHNKEKQYKGREVVMSQKESIKRYILCFFSLLVLGFAVAFTKVANLGVSPISSIANVMSIGVPQLSIGNWLIIENCLMIVIQIVLLRREFKPFQFLQIVVSLLFGYFTDFGVWVISFLPPESYVMRLVYDGIGVVGLGIGISLSVTANVIMNPPESAVQAIAKVMGKEFGDIKTFFDLSCVAAAVVLSLIFSGKIAGIREGTLLCACLVGLAVKLSNRLFKDKVTAFLKK